MSQHKNINYSPDKLEVIISVVPKKKGTFYKDYLQSFEANFQLSILAQGTADEDILGYLGVEQSDKLVLLSVVKASVIDAVMEGLEEKFRTIKNGKGVAVAVPMTSVIGKLVYAFLSDDRNIVRS